jgi:hypothetical protein
MVLCADFAPAESADVESPLSSACRSAMRSEPAAARPVPHRDCSWKVAPQGPQVQTVSALNLESAQITKTARPIAMKDQTGL